MENIRQAIERAKQHPRQQTGISLEQSPRQEVRRAFGDARQSAERAQVTLDVAHLQSHRIVAYDGKDPRSRPFDLLRTEVLQSMDLKGWNVLAVTSPTPRCGKSLIAANLALSIARQRERQVLLVDLDLRKPNVATCLGLKSTEGVVGVLEGRSELYDAILTAQLGESSLEVLPTVPAANPSDLFGSSAIGMMLEKIKGVSPSRIVIVDLPPLLTGHDVISILPHVDAVLLVAAVGTTKVTEIKECSKYLEGTAVLRFALNKVSESTAPYVYY